MLGVTALEAGGIGVAALEGWLRIEEGG